VLISGDLECYLVILRMDFVFENICDIILDKS